MKSLKCEISPGAVIGPDRCVFGLFGGIGIRGADLSVGVYVCPAGLIAVLSFDVAFRDA